MNFKKIIPFTLVTGLLLTGCGTKSEVKKEEKAKTNISNSINGVFDGYRYNTDSYNLEGTTYDKNYSNGYRREIDKTNGRFGKGMKGAENIKGNQNNSKKSTLYDKEKKIYRDIKDSIKS